MYANIFTKTSRDRAFGVLLGAASLALMLWMGTAVYKDIDLSIYETLPPAFLELMGIPEGVDAASLAFGAIYSMMGAFVIAGLAISMGTATIAGEEFRGTLGLLLGNPRSRSAVLTSKTLSMIVLMALGGLIIWGAGYAIPGALGVDMAGVEVGALVIHMSVNALFYGFLAMAIGGWTGNTTAASGTAVGVMVVSYLAAGLLPLVESLDWLTKFFPWHYYLRSNPVSNGVDWGDLAILGGISVALFAIALVGVNRRDLRSRTTRVSMLDRAREHPMTKKVADRIAGSARVSRIAMKTISEHQGLLIVTSMIMFYTALMMGPIYAVMDEALLSAYGSFPDALLAMIGGADMSTPEGFLQAEIFSITGPVTFGVLTILIGARAVAGEEERGTMDLLMASPITRSHVITEKAVAMVGYAVVLGVVTFLGTWATVALGDMDITVNGIAAASTLLTLFGLVLGGVALLVGSTTGRAKIASYAAIGVGLIGYFLSSFLPLSEKYADWAYVSPYHYFLSSDPLTNGMHWGHAAVLAGSFLLLVAVAVPMFERRDLRG